MAHRAGKRLEVRTIGRFDARAEGGFGPDESEPWPARATAV